jgi:WD40 repeat protein
VASAPAARRRTRKLPSTSFWKKRDPVRNALVLALLASTQLLAADLPDRALSADAVVNSIFFSPDGKTIVANYSDKHVRTWDVGSGKIIHDRTFPLAVQLLDSNDLAEPTDESKPGMRIWDLTAERRIEIVNGTRGHKAVSSDRKQMAFSSAGERTVHLINLATGEQQRLMADGVGGAAALVFSPDGSALVSANYDNDIRIWKTKSGELVRKIEDLTGAMFAAEFTPNGKELVMGGLDEIVYILDAKTFALNRTLKGHGETISSLAISPDGRTLVTGGFDVVTQKNPVKVVFWDLAAGTITRTLHSPHAVSSLSFSPDGKWLAMAANGSKEISLFSLNSSTSKN